MRYDSADQADIRFLVENAAVKMENVRKAIQDLPDQFRDDPLVQENMQNLEVDAALWEEE